MVADHPAADLVAVDHGQVPVQDDDVVVVDRHLLQGAGPVADDVHGHRLTPQPGGDGLSQVLLILHDEHAHRPASFTVDSFGWSLSEPAPVLPQHKRICEPRGNTAPGWLFPERTDATAPRPT